MEVEGQFAAARVQYEQAIRCNPEAEQVARETLHVLLDRLLDSLFFARKLPATNRFRQP